MLANNAACLPSNAPAAAARSEVALVRRIGLIAAAGTADGDGDGDGVDTLPSRAARWAS
jgi:hypothetical protein